MGRSNQVDQHLKSLSDATDYLCGLTYPNLNLGDAEYILLIKKLYSSQNNFDSSQAYAPVEMMINKLDQYLKKALDKPALICATILDPQIKLVSYQVIFFYFHF